MKKALSILFCFLSVTAFSQSYQQQINSLSTNKLNASTYNSYTTATANAIAGIISNINSATLANQAITTAFNNFTLAQQTKDNTQDAALANHAGNSSNPHNVTKAQVGLGNVPNVDATLRSNHTGTQAATTIVEDATHRFATDTEKSTWNAKYGTTDTTATVVTKGYLGPKLGSKLDISTYNTNRTTDQNATTAAQTTATNALTLAQQLTPTLNAETTTFYNRLLTAGGVMDAATVQAVDRLVSRAKIGGIWTKAVDVGLMAGQNSAAARVKLVAAPGTPTSYSAINMVESDYDQTRGFFLYSNSNKYLSTGLVPASVGVTSTSMTMAAFIPDGTSGSNSGALVGDNPASGDVSVFVNSNQLGFLSALSNSGAGGQRVQLMSFNGSNEYGYTNNILSYSYTAWGGGGYALNSEVTIFKSTRNGVVYYQTGSIGGWFVFSGLTQTESALLSSIITDFYKQIGRISLVGGVVVYFGDSITGGVGGTTSTRWSSVVARQIGQREVNAGVPSSAFRGNTASIVGGYNRYTDALAIDANTVVMMYGTNDLVNDGIASFTGTASNLTDVTTKTRTVIQNAKAYGRRLIICSPPYCYTSSAVGTKVKNYLEAFNSACSLEGGVTFVDCYNIFLDTGSPDSYMNDALHPNTAGHALIAQHVIAAFQGRIFRDAPLDFPSITAGSYQDLAVTMYGAKPGNACNVALPAALSAAGLQIQAFVSAADTVTVRLFNSTGGAYDPASAAYRVTVFLDN